jgi:hypothetical protein
MNPDRIWRELARQALAQQIAAREYGVFVAMPFRDQFSYRFQEIFARVIKEAVSCANSTNPPKHFADPLRSDTLAPTASEITDDIVEHILTDHFFIADLTLANHGVLVEVGVALALKTPQQIVLIAQGDLHDLHFDLKDNRVILYDSGRPAVEEIARALISGAQAFEASVGARMEAIRKSLSPKAVYLLNLYGRLRLAKPGMSLHTGTIANDANLSDDPGIRILIFNSAVQELLTRGLLELEYEPADDGKNPDTYGLHATDMGLEFIRQTWPKSLGKLK